MKVSELQSELQKLKLPVSGTKKVLLDSIMCKITPCHRTKTNASIDPSFIPPDGFDSCSR